MKVLVTGGGGFLGNALVRRLVEQGHQVRSFSRGRYPELEALGVDCHRGDVGHAQAVETAVAGSELVFHCAAKAGIWGPREDFFRTNLEGTRHVVEACQRKGVAKLVHTSTPSVCFDGHDHVNAGPDLPRATRFLAAYPESKAQAEEVVLAAHGSAGTGTAAGQARLATCALRPHLMFGPGDPHLIPRLLARARAGKLAVVGDAENVVSMTWIENAVEAHLAAASRLDLEAPHGGRAYFVAQEKPVRLWAWIQELLAALDVPAPRRHLSRRAAYGIGAACETLWRVTRLSGEPPMTRFLALQLATSHSYDMAPAREAFGYREQGSMTEATEKLIEHLRQPDRALST